MDPATTSVPVCTLLHTGRNVNFDFQAYSDAMAALGVFAPRLHHSERVTHESILKRGKIAFRTMVIGGAADLLTTHDVSVFARAHIPYTGIPCLVWAEGDMGIEHQLAALINLERLSRIKQLSLLSFPVRQGMPRCALNFVHTRFLHTYDVIALGLLCAHNAGIIGSDLLALNIALAIHDLFTATTGDLMKFVDPRMFDEDAALTQLLNHEPFLTLCRTLGIDPSEPIRICQSKDGTLCQIRDFADTLAYTVRDMDMFMSFFGQFAPGSESTPCYEDPFEQRLLVELYQLHTTTTFGLLWENLSVDTAGNLQFSDAQRLEEFLRARAIMFRILYYNRQTRNIEYVLGIRLVKILLAEKKIALTDFLTADLDDATFWLRVVYAITGYNPAHYNNGQLGQTHQCATLAEAQSFVRSLPESDASCTLIYRWPSATKTKVRYWNVPTPKGSKPWGEAYPDDAKRIEKIMGIYDGFHIAVFHRAHLHEIKDAYWEALRKLQCELL